MGDVDALDRIAIFIGNQPTPSKGPTSGIEESTSPVDTSNNLHLKYTRLCTALAQTTAQIDPKGGLCDSGPLKSQFSSFADSSVRWVEQPAPSNYPDLEQRWYRISPYTCE